MKWSGFFIILENLVHQAKTTQLKMSSTDDIKISLVPVPVGNFWF